MKTIFSKEYDGEDLYDLNRDISEALDERFNTLVGSIPTDENGIQEGKFIVTVKWTAHEDD
ncbi:hypothetical protein EJP02_147 [Escherichia phage EJP2]|nr:hypothetical protein EJP02_147 [Escherichia phage EJP2]